MKEDRRKSWARPCEKAATVEKKYLVIFGNGLGDFTPEFLRFKVTLLVTRYDETLKTRGPNFVCDFPQNFLNLGKKKKKTHETRKGRQLQYDELDFDSKAEEILWEVTDKVRVSRLQQFVVPCDKQSYFE